MDRTAVVTDSTARPVPARVQVVDLDVVLDGRPVREVDTDLDRLLPAMASGSSVGTSRPSPDGFARAYAQAAEAGASGVVSVHLSGALSGTVDAARLAATQAPVRVEVVDTAAVGAVLSAAVSAAADLTADGADVARAARLARAVGELSRTWFSPATAGHLHRGGRSEQAGTGRPGLTARSLLVVQNGHLVPLERVRTTSRLLDRLCQLVRERSGELVQAAPGATVEVVVQHAGAPEVAHDLLDRLRASAGAPVRTLALSPVLAAHVGPGAVGVAVVVVPGQGRSR